MKKPVADESVSSAYSPSEDEDTIQPVFMYHSPQERGNLIEGRWELVNAEIHAWKYRASNGSYVKDGWIYVENPYSAGKEKCDWFHFDRNGIMTFGWYQSEEGRWYYCHEISDGNLGALMTGWYEDLQEEKKYYLDPKTGAMLSGWQEIEGDSYYFATAADASDNRCYGSMYVNERTPDGYWVTESGKKIIEDKNGL